MNWNNNITQLLKLKYPFIQAPMLGYSTPEMVAAASNSGILGSLPLGLMSKEKAKTVIQATKKLTGSRFSVNVFVYPNPPELKDISLKVLESYYTQNNLSIPVFPKEIPYPSYEELIEVIIEEEVPVVSFTFGIPSLNIVQQLKAKGILLIGVATCTSEAKIIQDAGLDIVVAQGIEAGGHRGSFILEDLPQVGLISLLPQIIDSVQIPVVAAGGLSQGKSIAAAFILGAQGAQIGSAFLRSNESAASAIHKELMLTLNDKATVITNAWTGRFARMISNDFIKEIPPEQILDYPYQNYMTAVLRQFGKEQNRPDIQTLYAGQSAKYAKDGSTAEIIRELISETEDVINNSQKIFNYL